MRFLKIVLCMVAVAALTATFIPMPADGVPTQCLLCDVSESRNLWGHGSTCAAATSDLFSQAAAIRLQVCNSQYQSACGIPTTTVTTSCYTANGQKVVDGTTFFNCRSGDTEPCFGGIPPM